VVALGDVPDQERNVGDDVDSLDDREDGPERVDHAERGGEERGEDRDTLGTSRDSVDLGNCVGAGIFGSKVLEPDCHLSVRIR